MRTGWIVTLALAAAGMPALAAPPAKPRLIVVIAVDQFSDELYRRYRTTFTGGLKRLGGGISFTGYQSHAATETCPGHSTILTGRHPAGTGIVANTWRDQATGAHVYCVSVPGVADPEARGPQHLRVETFGDWLKRSRPLARVISVSGKDRAAIMLGGHHADAVYWWKDGVGFDTSPYAGPAGELVTAPAQAFDAAQFARWRAAPPQLWPDALPPACAALQQPHRFGGIEQSGKVPPDIAIAAEKAGIDGRDFPTQLRASPIFDPMTLDFASRLIDRNRLGHGPDTDLLAVSLSATDLIGHRYGNGGAETCVQMGALDRALGTFLAKLDRLRVPYVVALTADHGASDAPERAAERGVPATRIDPASFVKALNAHLQATLALQSPPIAGDDPQELSIVTSEPASRARVQAAALAWLKAQPDVVAVLTADQVVAAVTSPGKPVTALSLAERLHESYDPARSGDIQVEFGEHVTIGMPHKAGEAVAGHGTPWDHDRRVPMLFWWPGIRPMQRKEPAETVDIAPTLAAIARVPAPPVDGRCLAIVAGSCADDARGRALSPN